MRYSEEEQIFLLNYCSNLSEKARRHFLAMQYKQLGEGSQRYISEVFSCSRITITRGLRELAMQDEETIDYSRQRRAGGGRKKRERR